MMKSNVPVVIQLFGVRLKLLREQRGYTQEELAEKLGVQRPTIAGYESDEKKRIPRRETMDKIASLFDVSTDYLLGRTDDPSPVGKELKYRYPTDNLSPGTMQFVQAINLDDVEAIRKLKKILLHNGKELPDEAIKEILSYARYKANQ